jgi:aryl-alcohol dehydrogenase-like predicted oxidoreductase
MHDMIARGKALYWGTSEWSASEIMAAWQVAERHHLHKPIVEQPEYNIFHRERVEREYARLYEDIGIGLTTWSPLASGLLTGKYRDGIPPDSRGAIPRMKFLLDGLTDKARNQAVAGLEPVAKDLGCSMAQLAIAWCAANSNVSTVITGASRVAQVKDNLKAAEVIAKITPAVRDRLDAAIRAAGAHVE